jgi:hypothetical protein
LGRRIGSWLDRREVAAGERSGGQAVGDDAEHGACDVLETTLDEVQVTDLPASEPCCANGA